MRKYYTDYFFYMVGIFMLAACYHNDKPNSTGVDMTDSEKEVLFQMILDHSDLQQYLNPYIDGGLRLTVKSNDELGTNLSIEKFGKKVRFIASDDDSSSMPIFKVYLFKVENTRVTFDIAYEVEGVVIQGVFLKRESGWSFGQIDIFEG